MKEDQELQRKKNKKLKNGLSENDESLIANFCLSEKNSLRKQTKFRDATTGFPAKWLLRNERRNSILMTRHTPDMGSASDWSWRLGNLIQPIRSTTQIWVVTRHQDGISALVSQTSFGGEPALASSNVGRFLRLLKNRKVKFRSKSLYSYQVSSKWGNGGKCRIFLRGIQTLPDF